jgi:sugar lactone lactonase YvrE
MKERDLNRRIEAFLKLPNALAAILVASFVGQACSSSGLKTNAGSPGGNVDSGGTVGSGGTIVPGLAVFAGVPSGIGTADGTGAAARFNEPAGVAVHGAGNIFVVDNWNHTIRKITPSGVVTTLAGTAGLSGSADGTGAAARFYRPEGVAVDGAGNVFVADNWNHTIRKITPSGVVTTLAGTANISGSADGGAAAARFYYPSGVAVDGAGNLFVADSANFTIRKITPNGVVTTLAGSAGLLGSADGTGAAARFDSPCGLAVDGAGNVFVADNYTIRKITPSGVVTTLAGLADSQGSADGTGAAARFNGPSGVAVDGAGNLFVRDSDYNTYTYTIRKITYAGVVTTLAGTAGMSGNGIAVDGAGNLLVADRFNNTIRKITPAGVVTTLAGMGRSAGSADGTGAAARFSYTDPGLSSSFGPTGVAVDGAGSVFVADTDNDTIRKITPTGVVTTLAGTARLYGSADGAGAAASFGRPQGVAVDGVGNVFVADTDNNTIRKIEPSGVVTTLAGPGPLSGDVGADGTGAAARFDRPFGVAADETGNVFVADGSIRKITLAGVVTTLAGSAELFGSADGTGAAARFYSPSGVAVDGAGNVFVADTGNNAIRKITPAGVVTTLAGSADGTGAAALFNGPQGVAVDGTGNVFVADTGNNAIRKISTSGVVTTVVGVAAAVSAGNFPGPLPASIVSPVGVAIDASTGKLYITLQDAVMVAVLPN